MAVYSISFSLTFNPLIVSAAQIVTDGRTQTSLQINGSTTDVRTNTIRGSNGFNSFNKFDVYSGNTVNLHLPAQTNNLINLVHGQRSYIDGVLNSVKNGQIGGNVFFANPFGVVVGQTGRVNVGSINISTPTQSFLEKFFDSAGSVSDLAAQQLMNGQIPVSPDGLISIKGKVNAIDDIKLLAQDIDISGGLFNGAVYQSGLADFSDVVNISRLNVAGGAIVNNGEIEIVAIGDARLSGEVVADGGDNVDAGKIRIRAGEQLTLETGALLSAEGQGQNSSGGVIDTWSDDSAEFSQGAAINANAGTTGDGGQVEFSAKNKVKLSGGQFSASAQAGEAGTVLIDPEDIEVVNSDIVLAGTNFELIANNSITVEENILISTRDVDQSDKSVGDSGDIRLEADHISLKKGSQLRADANNGKRAGTVTLTNLMADVNIDDIDPATYIFGDGVLSDIIGTNDFGDIVGTGTNEETQAFAKRLLNFDDDVSITTNGATIKGGTVNLDLYASNRFGFNKDANASITLNDTLIEAETINIVSEADTSLVPDFTDDSSLPDSELIVDTFFPVNDSAYYTRSKATSKIEVKGSSQLLSSGDTNIKAKATSKTNPLSFNLPIGGAWSDSTAIANIRILNTATILATGVSAIEALVNNQATSEVITQTSSNAIPFDVSFSVVKAENQATIETGVDTEIEASKVQMLSNIEVEYSSSASATKTSGSSIGAAFAYSDVSNTAKIDIAGDVRATGSATLATETDDDKPKNGDIYLQAKIESEHDVSSDATSKGGDLKYLAKFKNQVEEVKNSLLASMIAPLNKHSQLIADFFIPTYKTGKLNLSGSVSMANSENSAEVNINRGGKVFAAKDVKLNADIQDDVYIGASALSTSKGAAAGGAVALGDYRNSAKASIGSGAIVNAGEQLDVTANSVVPNPTTAFIFDFSNAGSALDTMDALSGGIDTLLLSSGVFNAAKGSDFALAAGVNVFDMSNNAEATIAGNASAKNIGVLATTETDVVNAAGFDPRNRKPTTGGGSGLGGSINLTSLSSDTIATIADGAVVTATGDANSDVNVNAQSTVNAIEITVAGGKTDKVGVNGAISLFDAELTTEASIGDEATVNAQHDVNVTADNDIDILNVAGGFVKSGSLGVGASVASNNVESHADAFVGNHSSETNHTISPDRKKVTAANELEIAARSEGGIEAYSFAGAAATGSSADSGDSSGDSSGGSSSGGSSAGSSSTSGSSGGKKSSYGVAISGQVSINEINANTNAYIQDAEVESDTLTLTADDHALDIAVISGAASYAGGKSGSGALAGGYSQNTIKGSNAAYLSNAIVNAGMVTIDALSGGVIKALSAALGVSTSSKGLGVAASVTNNRIIDQIIKASIDKGSLVNADRINITANNAATIQSLAGAISLSGKAAVGGAIALNRIETELEASINGSSTTVNTTESAIVKVNSDAAIETISVGAALGKSVGISGSVSSNVVNNKTVASIYDGAQVAAENNIGVIAENDDRISVAAGSLGIGASAGIGASVVVNNIGSTTKASIEGASTRVNAKAKDSSDLLTVASGALSSSIDLGNAVDLENYGKITLKDKKETQTVRGVAVNASATQHVEAIAANVGAGKLGVGITVNVNEIGGNTTALIDGAQINDDSAGGNAAQQVNVSASNHAYGNGFAGVAGAGKAGVGAATDVTTISRSTTASIKNASDVNAKGDLDVEAYSTQGVSSLAVGGAAGAGGVAGTGSLAKFNANTEATISNASVTAQTVDVKADSENNMHLVGGAIAAGGLAVAGTFTVGLSENNTRAAIEGVNGQRSTIDADNVSVVAQSDTAITDVAISGAGAGGFAVAGMAAVNIVTNQTEAVVQRTNLGTSTNRINSLMVNASDSITIDSKAGALAGGSSGVGAGAAVNIIKSGVSSLIDDSTVYATGPVTVLSISEKVLSTIAAAGGVGGTAGIGGAAVVNLLGAEMDADTKGEVNKGDSGTLSEVDSFASSSKTGNQLDNIDETDLSTAERNAVESGASGSVNTPTTIFKTAAEIRGVNTVVDAGSVSVKAQDKTKVESTVGGLGVGSLGVGGAVAYTSVKNNVVATIDSGVDVNAATVSVQALAGKSDTTLANSAPFKVDLVNNPSGVNCQDVICSQALAGAAGIVGLGAAVTVSNVENNVSASLGGDLTGNGTGNVIVKADDSSSIYTDSVGASAGAAAAGVVVAHANKESTVTAKTADNTQLSSYKKLDVIANSQGTVEAKSLGAAGGLFAAGNGSDAEVTDKVKVTAALGDRTSTNTVFDQVSVKATATPNVKADAQGYTVSGGLTIGVSIAKAVASSSVLAQVGKNVLVNTQAFSVVAETLLSADGYTTKSRAIAAGGGLLAGLGATDSRVENNAKSELLIDENTVLNATNNLTLSAGGNSYSRADVTGINAGIVAAGSNNAKATSATKRTLEIADNVKITGGILTINAGGEDKTFAKAIAGSGGLVSGAASSAKTVNGNQSTISIGNRGATGGIDVNSAIITAKNTSRFNSQTDSTNASLLGASGASANNTVNSVVGLLFGTGAKLAARSIQLAANNTVRKTGLTGYNVYSGSGGAIDAAAAGSNTVIKNNTAINFGTASNIDLTGDRKTPGAFTVNVFNDIEAKDRSKLDSGGAIAIARAESFIHNSQNTGRILVDDSAALTSVGDIRMGIKTRTHLDANANAKTYGAAGAAQGHSIASANVDNSIDIGSNATMDAKGDMNLSVGADTSGVSSSYEIYANTDLYNKTVLPIETKPDADASLNQHNTITIAQHAELTSVGDARLLASKGDVAVKGYGVGKDLYREALAAVGSFFSNLVGGGDVSLDIKGGKTTNVASSTVKVDGKVEVGTENERILIIDSNGQVDTAQSSEGITVTKTTEVLSNTIQARIDELDEMITALESNVAGNSNSTSSGGELDTLNDELVAKRAEKTSVQGQITSNNSTIASNTSTINANNSDISGWNSSISTLNTQIAALDAEKDAALIQQKRNEIAALNGRVTTAQNQNATLASENSSLTSDNNNYSTIISSLTSEIADVESKISMAVAPADDIDPNNIDNLVGAYKAEKSWLEYRLNSLGGDTSTVGVLKVDQELTARSSNIYIEGDSLASSGGQLIAPGDTLINIENNSGNFLRTNKMTIPQEAGGKILFNGALVANESDINARNRGNTARFTTVETSADSTPTISVINKFLPQGGEMAPDIYIDEDISNISGLVDIRSLRGSVQIKDGVDIVADTIKLAAGKDIMVGYKEGIRNVGGDIKTHWNSYKNIAEASGNDYSTGSRTVENLLGISKPYDDPTYLAGNNIFISSQYLNINGVIQSGLPSRTVNIVGQVATDLAKEVADYQQAYDSGLQTERYFKNLKINNGIANDISKVAVFYDAVDKTLELEPVNIMGGYVEVYGHILNTSLGEIKVMDGYGTIDIDNETDIALRLTGLDTGSGIEGTVKITDTAYRTASNESLITVYKHLNNSVKTFTNASGVLDLDNAVSSTGGDFSFYQPLANQYYSWTDSVEVVKNATREKVKKHYFGISGGTKTYFTGYSSIERSRKSVSDDVIRVVAGHDEAYWYDKTYLSYASEWKTVAGSENVDEYVVYRKTTWDQARTETQYTLHNHNVKAFNPIKISFMGDDSGTIDVASNGKISIDGSIKNTKGNTTITSRNGQIVQGEPLAQMTVDQVTLNANQSIGSASSAIKMDLVEGGTVAATSTNGSIYLDEANGDMTIRTIQALKGDVSLSAERNIVGENSSHTINANNIDLVSLQGNLGSSAQSLSLNSNVTSGVTGGVTALAGGDVYLQELAGDMYVNAIESLGGDVSIVVNTGDVVDFNLVEVEDERAANNLLDALYNDMDLLGTNAENAKQQMIAAQERMKTREYQTYWKYRSQQADSTQYNDQHKVQLTAIEDDHYRNTLGWSDAEVADLEAKRTEDYHRLHASYGSLGDSVDGSFEYKIAENSDEWNGLTAGFSWTKPQLENSIGAGILKEVSDTELVIEDANIIGHNIEITANNGGIGYDNAASPMVIKLDGRTFTQLTKAEQLAIAAAESNDYQIISDNEIHITDFDDVDLDASGLVAATARDNIYLGSEQTLVLDEVSSTNGDVRLKVGGGLYADSNSTAAIKANNLIVEAASNSIGHLVNLTGGETRLDAMLIDVAAAGQLTARAGDSINITETTGNINVESIYAVNDVNLTTGGSILDASDDDLLDIRSDNLVLNAGDSIGSATNALEIGLNANGALNATASSGGVYIKSPKRDINVANIVANGDVSVTSGGGLAIASATGGIVSQLGMVTLDALGGISDSDAEDNNLLISAMNIIINSTTGSIGEASNSLQVDTLSLAANEFSAATGISVTEVMGDMAIAQAQSTDGVVNLVSAQGDIQLGAVSAGEAVSLIAKGSVLDANADAVNVDSKQVTIVAENGAIGSVADAIELAGIDTQLTASASGDIALAQTESNLLLAKVSSSLADVALTAKESILNGLATDDANVVGNTIALVSQNGSIGGQTKAVKINSAFSDQGQLTASAANDIYIEEVDGAMDIASMSIGASAGLVAEGDLLADELMALSGDLDVTSTNGNVVATTVTAANNASIDAAKDINVDTLKAGNNLFVASKANVQLNSLESGLDASINADETIQVADLSVTGNAELTAANIELGQAVIQGAARLNSVAQLMIGSIQSQQQLSLTSGGDIQANQLVAVLEGLTATSAGMVDIESATANTSVNIVAANDLSIGSVNAQSVVLESQRGDISNGLTQARQIRLAASGGVEAADIQVTESVDLEGDNIEADITHTGNTPTLLINATGYQNTLASNIDLTVKAVNETQIDKFYTANGEVATTSTRLSVADGWVTQKAAFATPKTDALVKNTDKALEAVDVQIFAEGDRFNLLIDDNYVKTDQYVVDYEPSHRVSSILGENQSLISQAEDAEAAVSAQIAAALRNAGVTSGLVGQSFVSYFLDQPMVNGMDISATASGPNDEHCALHPEAIECNELKDETFFDIR
nr:leukotoxin LktA family filamentous adhesin [Alkalimarinus sediminis]